MYIVYQIVNYINLYKLKMYLYLFSVYSMEYCKLTLKINE